ncbi:MAG: ribonuclease HI family protein, partial [Cyanobacteria bacterium P01_C01_bin.38]
METLINNWTVIYFDGAAEPSNPGPAAGAAVIDLPTGESLIATLDLGIQTNNVAEYSGAIAGLKKALELGCKRVKLFGDSQLVIYQLSGRYGVKNAVLKLLHSEATQLLTQFEEYSLDWIPRAQNSRAD